MSGDIAVVGLGVMGSNIARNFARNGFKVPIYNIDYSFTEKLLSFEEGKNMIPCRTYNDIKNCLKKPRKILMLVTDTAVDVVYRPFMDILEKGDIIIDGGNSHWKDTERRQKEVESTGIHFVGMGVSGGAAGALNGPSLMFGGDKEAWEACKNILLPIAAKSPEENEPCVAYMGTKGAGHFVKMVHNAIEYSDMQLIAETYDILKKLFKLDAESIGEIFGKWNNTKLKSYLIHITEIVLKQKDDQTKKPLVDMILDRAGQKGTGKWAAQDSFDLGIPTPGFAEAVCARILSSLKNERVEASKILQKKPISVTLNGILTITIDDLEKALYSAKIACYAQGLAMIQAASSDYGYGINCGDCAKVWRGGCIIRASFLNDVSQNYTDCTKNLMLIDKFSKDLEEGIEGWRKVVAVCALEGIPAPLFSTSLSYFDSYSSEFLPANLLQGLRDYFGAHTYERIDKPGSFHTNWD
ncbi:6-phosphogluconate dehydrogenase [Tritrichomonas foetus]|uniref:6-phosphogluconate dehydrogenase, decarboxylating n=1 Tax=Tritrichomonas foetus TaxID=1144522 RepID=A0A1J4KYV6_9EUKA|nr:6-phosphogluconate dehydrogenase [Tritrichomonas foetus]|eukprot:OHT16435.1 6-phosphogluconate dehydrogenase [Tritrichomonas foetus]